MKLMGKDIPALALLERIEDRLRARGLSMETSTPIRFDGPEARVDPLAFNLSALEEHADSTRAVRAVGLARWVFRKTCQVFIDETLSRQRLFNGHVRDSYAQLSADVISLRREVDALRRPKKR